MLKVGKIARSHHRKQPRQRLLAAAVEIDIKLEVIWQAVTSGVEPLSELLFRVSGKTRIITPLIFNPSIGIGCSDPIWL
jgi:hypothetical protein